MRGELDWIVMKCLEKDRNRRYETATALADDIGRYLEDQPVQACPPSLAYQFKKFVRRNKMAVALALAPVVVLLILAVSYFQVAHALEERNQALQQASFPLLVPPGQAKVRFDGDKALAMVRDLKESAIYDLDSGKKHGSPGRPEGSEFFGGAFEYVVRAKAMIDPKTRERTVSVEAGRRLSPPALKITRQAETVGVAFLPDGRKFVLACSSGQASLLDAEEGKELVTLKDWPGSFGVVAVSATGAYLAGGGTENLLPGPIGIWDLATGKEVVSMAGHPTKVTALAFSPDGRRLVSAGMDKTLKIWDTATGRELVTLRDLPSIPSQLAFTPDGNFLFSRDRHVRRWDLRPWSGHAGRVIDLSGGATPRSGIVIDGADEPAPGMDAGPSR